MTCAAVCVDVGSGWVKALGINSRGEPVECAQRPTVAGELLRGVHEAAASVGLGPDAVGSARAGAPKLLVCSSAGGGLRLAVVGEQKLITMEAGLQVARSAGARVVHVEVGALDPARVRALRSARPDVVLLLGSPDGSSEQLLINATRLARARVRAPIVLSASGELGARATELLESTGRTVLAAPPVLRGSGELVPEPARSTLASLLSAHLVGGRGPASTARFRRLAGRPTTSAVGSGLLRLAEMRRDPTQALLAVDVGSSTTDVYSVAPGARDVVCTAEADLGMRPSVAGILTEGQTEQVIDPVEADLLAPTVRRLAEETGFLPTDVGARAEDRRLAALAAVLALRRHLAVVGRELAEGGVGLLVLSGGVFRQPGGEGLAALRATLRCDVRLRSLLEHCPIAIDDGFALAPAGLLELAGRSDEANTILDAAIVPEAD
ncbi:MAG TPA: glutamate mutase L [Pseudonocardia sp.]|jgi:uncharacterized protein (TIGR01319 family)|nr:glutamate mutase L [Pseudonocardia sp.]